MNIPTRIEDIKRSEKSYNKFFAHNKWVKRLCDCGMVFPTWVQTHHKYSRDSFSLGDFIKSNNCKSRCDREETIFKRIIESFEILDKAEKLRAHFKEAIGGFELNRITTLHSSSLIAFLCFGLIDTIPIDVDGQRRSFKLKKLEWKNGNAPKGVNPNIDICLECTESGKECMLLLESKFSEYLTLKKSTDDYISPIVYNDTYNSIFPITMGKCDLRIISGVKRKGKESLAITSNEPHYLSGAKQLISHWMGVKDSKKTVKVYLGEILFKFSNCNPQKVDAYSDYQQLYSNISNRLLEIDQSVSLLPEILSYQDLFSDVEMPTGVKEFYNL